MDKVEKENMIDKLLVFMNDDVERQGYSITNFSFDFNENGEDAVRFMQEQQITHENLIALVNTSVARKYIKNKYMGNRYGALSLTEEGQGRAISVEAAKHAPKLNTGSTIHIGTLHSNGTTQIGNNNSQNIENTFNYILQQIETSDSSDAEKQEAKNLLNKFLAHPLVNTIIGSGATVLTSLSGGN